MKETISPLDGRYAPQLAVLLPYFSEAALMRYRVMVEVEYLITLSKEKSFLGVKPFPKTREKKYRDLYLKFDAKAARRIKQIEKKTNHDVKAVEYYLREKIDKKLHPWIHFALTSEDVNNLSYSLMWKDATKKVFLPLLLSLVSELKKLSRRYASYPMLSMTHGQSATPTTFGKEIAVFVNRLRRQYEQVKAQSFLGKFGGATGTWSTHVASYPKVNWLRFANTFIKKMGLEPNLVTTQIEPHDSLSESYHQLIRINTILIDLSHDFWYYISRGILEQKRIKDEVGSSAMPHKINPIQFENAEGNLGISTALLNHLSTKLPISRMQRDLSDSTALRNQGVAMGHSVLSIKNIINGLKRIKVNKTNLYNELDSHWEVLAEGVQTILRKSGNNSAYEKLKELTRGHKVDKELLSAFIEDLEIPTEDKKFLLSLTPHNYIGLAAEIAKLK